MKLIDKVVEEIKRLIRANELYLSEPETDEVRFQKVGAYSVLNDLLHFLDTLEVKEAQCASNDIELEAHAEEYSFNIESELFMQLTPEQQKLWRKEIEQAVISGGHFSLEHGLNIQHSNIGFQNIDDLFEEDGINPDSKDVKIFKEVYYTALERLKEKKGE